jgi:phage baseplate assembly protein W
MSQLEKNLYKRVSVSPNKATASTGRAYRGFSTISEKNEGYSLYDFELIKQDLINHFHIRQGEKLSDPTFGCIIWDLLYEPFTYSVQEAIVDNVTKIINYDPRIQADDVIVDSYDQGITVTCTITYLPYSIAEELKFKFDQKNGLA